VLERWGHSSVQCNSSCKAPGVWHQAGHALHDLGTLGRNVTQSFNVRVVRVCAQFDQADELDDGGDARAGPTVVYYAPAYVSGESQGMSEMGGGAWPAGRAISAL
jgi:hypothetical protein